MVRISFLGSRRETLKECCKHLAITLSSLSFAKSGEDRVIPMQMDDVYLPLILAGLPLLDASGPYYKNTSQISLPPDNIQKLIWQNLRVN